MAQSFARNSSWDLGVAQLESVGKGLARQVSRREVSPAPPTHYT
ncbi:MULTISPECIES: hypothetical protein [Thermoleptolyngbya]|nr:MULTISPECIES: hypothetical protein [Thermoleptolyngbya]